MTKKQEEDAGRSTLVEGISFGQRERRIWSMSYRTEYIHTLHTEWSGMVWTDIHMPSILDIYWIYWIYCTHRKHTSYKMRQRKTKGGRSLKIQVLIVEHHVNRRCWQTYLIFSRFVWSFCTWHSLENISKNVVFEITMFIQNIVKNTKYKNLTHKSKTVS